MTENTVLDNNVSSIIKKENCIPKLRFSEFSTAWDLIRLSDVTTSFDYGLAYPSKEYDGENKYIRITDIDEETNSYCKNDIVSPDGKLTKDYLVDENDILFARTGASTGKTYLYNCEDGKLYFAGFLIRAHIKEAINSKFIFLNTQTFRYKKWVAITSMRSGQPGINSQEYANYKFYLPNKMEQDKIADFITLIDNLILEQKSNISILETYNKGLISQIFKQEIRFKDDNGNEFPNWKNKKLGDCVTVKRGSSPRPIEKYITNDDNGINWIKIGDAPIDANIITEVKEKITIEGAGKSRRVYVGDLILSNSMSFGRPYILEVDGCIHDGWLLIRDERNIFDLKYLCYLLNSEEVIRQYGMYAAGSTVNNLNSELVQSVKIQLPSLEEQQKIADCLSAIDKVMEQEKVYLEQLKTIKKGLLQQMFV